METKELMAQNVQDPAQAGEVLLQPPKRPKKKRSIKKSCCFHWRALRCWPWRATPF